MEQGGERFLETLERDEDGAALYVREKDATVVQPATALPTGVKPHRKWMLVSITQGTLVAYEGLTPVFATLISPGRGGVPAPGRDHIADSTTPIGTYNITFKDRAATMSADPPGGYLTHFIADVPHVQYFKAPFALHGAYWHERFGEPAQRRLHQRLAPRCPGALRLERPPGAGGLAGRGRCGRARERGNDRDRGNALSGS